MSDYKDRLLIEQRDLRDKIEKLTDFLSTNHLNKYKRHKLRQQREAMLSYCETLEDRLIDAGVIKSANPERQPKEGVNGYVHGGPGDGEVILSELETIRIGEDHNQPVSFDPSRPVPEKMWLITYRKKEWGLNDYRWYEWYVEHDPREEEKPSSI
jgi:hypothetical protein